MCMSKSLEELAKADKAYLKKLKYSQKKYNDNFRQKHADEIKKKITCNACGHQYSYYSKSKHLKTKRHNKIPEIMAVVPEVPEVIINPLQ